MSVEQLKNGIFPVQHLEMAISDGVITAEYPIEDGQLQPASLDLRLGSEAWRVQASFLPGENMFVDGKLAKFGMHKIDLTNGAVLERGCVYIVRLQERLNLPAGTSAMANPKSSTGRLDIFTRLITDGAREFESLLMDMKARYMLKFHHAPSLFWCAPDRVCHNYGFGAASVLPLIM